MLRSDINRMIEEAMREFEKKGLILPAWAYWDVKEWYKNPGLGNEIRKDGLGWRVSDFGLGDFMAECSLQCLIHRLRLAAKKA